MKETNEKQLSPVVFYEISKETSEAEASIFSEKPFLKHM